MSTTDWQDEIDIATASPEKFVIVTHQKLVC
jgi:hypothetical protein